MKCEQFISLLSRLVAASPNLEKILSLEELEFLIHLGSMADKPRCLRTIINDQYAAVSYIVPVNDEYNRKGVYNHTIIVSLKDYFNGTSPTRMFWPYFHKDTENLPRRLSSLKCEPQCICRKKRE